MRILAIGDFHGKFPEKLKKEAKKADFILSTGDYADADKIRKIIFANWADKWYEVVGLNAAKKLEKESFYSGLNVLKELGKVGKKVYSIWGNTDFYKEHRKSLADEINPGFYEDKIKKLKNIKLIDKKKIKINAVDIFGHGGYVDVTEFIKNPIDSDKNMQVKRLKRYNKTKDKLFALFEKKHSDGFIFLAHYPPYKVFDKIKFKGNPMNGKHVGFEPYNQVIKKYKPALVICGHMHENQGMKNIGGTTIVATGTACEGKAAIIDFDEQKKRVKNVRFLR